MIPIKIKSTKKCFDIFPYKNNSPYSIELKMVKDDGLDIWIKHLRKKNWWNEWLEKDFVSWAKNLHYDKESK